MTITTYLFGLWLLSSGAALLFPIQLQIRMRFGLICIAPVLLGLSVVLQGLFPASMVCSAILVMEPGPLRWLVQTGRRHLLQAVPV
jgi:hypothetical protein